MFLLGVVLSVHDSTKINMQETWTGNTTTKRNMDRQYNDQKKHGQAIQRPKETMFLLVVVLPVHVSCMFLLVVVLSVHVSFGRYIACSCFFWSLYCLSKETWTDNTTTK
jgi:hypothetical protein